MKKTTLLALLALLPLSESFAGTCLVGHTESVLLNGKSAAFAKIQDRSTWEDWIWRGPIFLCPQGSGGVTSCTYIWGQTKTTGYQWGGTVGLNLDKIPVIGSALSLVSVSGNYSHQQSFSTNYNWNIAVEPGYYAQPIQVVVRRWTQGSYRGGYVRDASKSCSTTIAGTPQPNWYNWDDSVVAGRWTANIEQSRYASYYVHK